MQDDLYTILVISLRMDACRKNFIICLLFMYAEFIERCLVLGIFGKISYNTIGVSWIPQAKLLIAET